MFEPMTLEEMLAVNCITLKTYNKMKAEQEKHKAERAIAFDALLAQCRKNSEAPKRVILKSKKLSPKN